jgi:hypothetical protein
VKQFATTSSHRLTQLLVPHRAVSIGHLRAHRSGYRLCKPARLAGQTPRSVISAVTNLAGVTSNAKLSPGLPSGTTLTVSIAPDAVWPVTCVTSLADRSSMGIPEHSSRDQSMLLRGSAT